MHRGMTVARRLALGFGLLCILMLLIAVATGEGLAPGLELEVAKRVVRGADVGSLRGQPQTCSAVRHRVHLGLLVSGAQAPLAGPVDIALMTEHAV